MDENISWTKLLRYVRGGCRPEERAEVEEWIASDAGHEDLILFLEKVLDTPAEPKEDWDVDSAWLRYNIRHGRDFDEGPEEEEDVSAGEKIQNRRLETSTGKKSHTLTWGLVAAAAAMISLILLFTVPNEQEVVSEVQTETLKEIVSEYGQRTHFRLSDGTRVIVNAGSRITTPETFSDSVRRVRLEGQAFFNVATDSARPFLVSTDRAVTEVLGTKFGIWAYPEDELVEVTVAEGKVALRSKQDTAHVGAKEIMRNQKGSLSPTGIARVTKVENMAVHLGWTEGKLVFSDEHFSRVKKALERYYNIHIEVENDSRKLKGRRFTGSFTDSQPLEEVLEAVALSLDMEYREGTSDNSHTFFKK